MSARGVGGCWSARPLATRAPPRAPRRLSPAPPPPDTNATRDRVGYARGVTGGFGATYSPAVAAAFLSLDACPEELLLSFHNVPYTHVLKGARYGGRSVLQWIYASHADGAATSAAFVPAWRALAGQLDLRAYAVGGASEADIFANVTGRLQLGAADAATFAASVTSYFVKLTGVPPAGAEAAAPR